MFNHLLVLLMLASPLLALNCNYDDFLQEFKPNQQPSQFSKERKQRFEQITCPQLNKMMQDSPQLVLNLNEDADLSQEELFLKKGLNNFEKIKPEDMKVGSIQNDQKLSATMMPRYLNYVIKGSVSSVQDQGSCGSFWAFAAVAYYESQLLMRNKTEYQISQEAVLQCSYQQSIYPQPISSCSGGYFLDGLAYLAKFGGVSKRNYPYISGDYGSSKGFKIVPGICQQKNRIKIEKQHVNAYFDLQDEQLKLLLNTKGPVYAIFSANYYFSFYTSGIFEYCYVNAFSYLNHAVLVVGYSDNQRYWLVKNSWGTSWGEKGFGKIPYSRNCGLTLLVGIIDQKDVTVEAGENYMLLRYVPMVLLGLLILK